MSKMMLRRIPTSALHVHLKLLLGVVRGDVLLRRVENPVRRLRGTLLDHRVREFRQVLRRSPRHRRIPQIQQEIPVVDDASTCGRETDSINSRSLISCWPQFALREGKLQIFLRISARRGIFLDFPRLVKEKSRGNPSRLRPQWTVARSPSWSLPEACFTRNFLLNATISLNKRRLLQHVLCSRLRNRGGYTRHSNTTESLRVSWWSHSDDIRDTPRRIQILRSTAVSPSSRPSSTSTSLSPTNEILLIKQYP